MWSKYENIFTGAYCLLMTNVVYINGKTIMEISGWRQNIYFELHTKEKKDARDRLRVIYSAFNKTDMFIVKGFFALSCIS